MKKSKKTILFIIFILSQVAFGQTYNQTSVFGKFEDASSVTMSATGFIYVSDVGSNEVSKFDTLGNKLNFIGGYGWKASTFDEPTDIFATALNLYVTDKNNDRIQFFDKDLNYISELNSDGSEIEFGYPLSSEVDIQNNLYVLDSDNIRILKLNQDGSLILKFGDYEAGKFVLTNPKAMTVSRNSNVVIIDEERVLIFDQFGNGLTKLKLNFEPTNINHFNGNITLVNDHNVFLIKGSSNSLPQKVIIIPKTEDIIKDALLFNGKLYLLTNKELIVFEPTNE